MPEKSVSDPAKDKTKQNKKPHKTARLDNRALRANSGS